MTWFQILENWGLVLRDLASIYHLDLSDPATLARPWPGVRDYITGLLDEPTSRLYLTLKG